MPQYHSVQHKLQQSDRYKQPPDQGPGALFSLSFCLRIEADTETDL
jgi:hypothetical protein